MIKLRSDTYMAPCIPTHSASTCMHVVVVRQLHLQGSGPSMRPGRPFHARAQLLLSLLLLPTLIYAPLSMVSIGRHLWIKMRFTNKRISIINTSPLFSRTIEIAYKNIKDVRTGPRAFGLWGDMVRPHALCNVGNGVHAWCAPAPTDPGRPYLGT